MNENKDCTALPTIEKLTPEIIQFNYYPGSLTGEYGEQYVEHIVGQKGVTEIREHAAQGDGDRWYWDVHYDNNQVLRIFNPHTVVYKKTIEPVTPIEYPHIDTTTKAVFP